MANSISYKCGHRCVCSNPSFSTICLWEPGDQVCFLYILHIRMCSFKFDGQKSDFNIGLQFYSGYIGQLRRLRSYCRATLYFTLYFVHALPLMSVQSIASWILTLCFDWLIHFFFAGRPTDRLMTKITIVHLSKGAHRIGGCGAYSHVGGLRLWQPHRWLCKCAALPVIISVNADGWIWTVAWTSKKVWFCLTIFLDCPIMESMNHAGR